MLAPYKFLTRYPAIDWPESTFLNTLFPSIYRKKLKEALDDYNKRTEEFFIKELAEDLDISYEEAKILRLNYNQQETKCQKTT